MGKIFVNYRRDDSAPHALSIAQYLERTFGARNVFIDIDRLRAGQNFHDVLQQRLALCDVMLAIIGPSWRDARAEDQSRRLDDPEDWVRLEISKALANNVTVIPILVGGATLPKPADLPVDLRPLVQRQAFRVTTNSFRTDMAGLEHDLRAIVGVHRRWLVPAAAVACFALIVIGAVYAFLPFQGLQPLPPAPVKPAPTDRSLPASPAPNTFTIHVDFSPANQAGPPNYTVAADSFLRGTKEVSVSVSARRPSESRIVFVNNLGLYGGRAVAPTVSHNFLTQIDTGNVPASFTLRFSSPVRGVSFVVPKVFPDTPSGVTFPAWKAIARGESGAELSSASEGLTRRFADVPSRTYNLTAPAFEGISTVEFQSDPNLNGRPFAGFSTLLIEQITLQTK
jgi:TIR domain